MQEKTENKVTEAMQDNYKTWNLIERFEEYRGYRGEYVKIFANRKVEEFDPRYGIADPVGIAYALRRDRSQKDKTIVEKFADLLQDSQAGKLEALVFGLWDKYWAWDEPGGELSDSSVVANLLIAAKDKLTSLKAVFLGDIPSDEFEISWIEQSNITPVLEAYPNLQMLQVRGGTGLLYARGGSALSFSPTRHDNLEVLVVETGGLSRQTIAQICALELPALKHMELWLGCDLYGGNSSVEDLMPILAGKLFPNLTYLGLRNSEYSDKIAAALVESPVLEKIAVLDLSMGNLGDEAALAFLDCPAINQLDILNVSENFLAEDTIERLQQLDCRVIAENQKEAEEREYENEKDYKYYRYCSVAE